MTVMVKGTNHCHGKRDKSLSWKSGQITHCKMDKSFFIIKANKVNHYRAKWDTYLSSNIWDT